MVPVCTLIADASPHLECTAVSGKDYNVAIKDANNYQCLSPDDIGAMIEACNK